MKDNSLSKLGGTCSILLGILYLLIGVTYLMLPAEQKQTSAVDKFLPSFAENPTTQTIQFWGFALSGLVAIAVVLAVSESVRSGNEGWVRWTSTLAILGFAVVAINNFRNIAFQPGLARAYYVGIATAVAYWLIVTGFVFNQETLFTIGAALGGILLAPVWYIWAGLRLRQAD